MRKNQTGKFRFGQHKIKDAILKQARKEDNIVFGAQAIKRKLGINARKTQDYDMFSKMPKKSANTTEKALDKVFRKDLFFTKKGKNKTTHKVKFIGGDGRKNTKDDIGVADYTKTPSPAPETFNFRGVRYRVLKQELAAKIKTVKDPKFDFRKEKDLQDIKRIVRFGRGL